MSFLQIFLSKYFFILADKRLNECVLVISCFLEVSALSIQKSTVHSARFSSETTVSQSNCSLLFKGLLYFLCCSSSWFDDTGSNPEVCVFRQCRQDIEDYIVSLIQQHQFQQNNGQQASALHPQPQVPCSGSMLLGSKLGFMFNPIDVDLWWSISIKCLTWHYY